MKNCKKHFLVALVVLICGQFLAPKAAQAQVIEVGGSVGLSYYMGDINPKKPFNSSELGWGILARYYSNTRWALRLAYSNLQLNGSDAKSKYREERDLEFMTKAHDVALIAEFNFFEYFTGSKRNKLSPYIFGGLSVFGFNPKNADGVELCDKPSDTEEADLTVEKDKYGKISASIPFGMGVKYSLGNKIGVALEWRWDYTFTDWIDDCHAYYPQTGNDYSDPTSGHMFSGNKYVQRGNKEDDDWFGYLNVSIIYKFILPGANDCKTEKRNAYNTY